MTKVILIITLNFLFFNVAVHAGESGGLTSKYIEQCEAVIDKSFEYSNPRIKGLSKKEHHFLIKGLEYVEKEMFEKASEYYQEIIESRPSDHVLALIYKTLAYMHVQAENKNAAYSSFNRALEYGKTYSTNKELQKLRFYAASYMYSSGYENKAVYYFEDWLKHSAYGNAEVFTILSALYLDDKIQRYEDAVCIAYEGTQLEDGPSRELYELLLNAHFKLKDLSGAYKVTKRMSKLFPNDKRVKERLNNLSGYSS